jgi:hypothetical protein
MFLTCVFRFRAAAPLSSFYAPAAEHLPDLAKFLLQMGIYPETVKLACLFRAGCATL